jgi:hypothetical protein
VDELLLVRAHRLGEEVALGLCETQMGRHARSSWCRSATLIRYQYSIEYEYYCTTHCTVSTVSERRIGLLTKFVRISSAEDAIFWIGLLLEDSARGNILKVLFPPRQDFFAGNDAFHEDDSVALEPLPKLLVGCVLRNGFEPPKDIGSELSLQEYSQAMKHQADNSTGTRTVIRTCADTYGTHSTPLVTLDVELRDMAPLRVLKGNGRRLTDDSGGHDWCENDPALVGR